VVPVTNGATLTFFAAKGAVPIFLAANGEVAYFCRWNEAVLAVFIKYDGRLENDEPEYPDPTVCPTDSSGRRKNPTSAIAIRFSTMRSYCPGPR